MSQDSKTISNGPGATVRAAINAAIARLATRGKGGTAPSDIAAGEVWIDDNTPSASKWTEAVYDGTDSIKMAEIDTTNNVYVAQVGGGTATIASATTTDLGGSFEASITVSGTTTITSFGSTAPKGTFKFVTFSGALLLTHNGTSLILPGGTNITTVAGDTLLAEHLGSGNWRVHRYSPGAGTWVKTVATTYDISTTGSLAVTGVGFRPKLVLIQSLVNNSKAWSHGYFDGTNNGLLASNGANSAETVVDSTTYCASLATSSGVQALLAGASLDADGVTLTRTKSGSPTGTGRLYIHCFA